MSTTSHELRTPLNAILGFAQLLLRDKLEPLSPRHRDHVDQISRAGEQLLRLIEHDIERSSTEVTQGPGDASLSHRRLLYVEDNLANVAFMRELCATLDDVELLVAGTAELGIELAQKELPDLIAMDINLPGMSGVEALRALRSDPATAAIPIVAVTAGGSSGDRRTAAGFDAYLTKPIHVDSFLRSLEGLLPSAK